jgi:flagellar biosynthetic protein FlhB
MIIGFVAFFVIQSELPRLTVMQATPFWLSISLIATLAMRLIIFAALMLLVLSVPDIIFQRRQYKESLKMTKQEVKEERKMYEGDPLVKSRLKQRMRELLSRNMAANVPKADVVITNPTHFAVALEWDRGSMPAPMVTAKGADEVALRIRKIAEDAGVPVVENRPLARALFAETEIGDIIPEQFYQLIAVVLAKVNKINEARGRGLASGE